MPIYEYYCPACDGRFSHLARGFNAPPPPCPGCGSREVEKLVSKVNLGRSEVARWADIEGRSWEVDRDNPQEMARFLQEAGSLTDEVAPIEREAFQEVIARRAEGAEDKDLQDIEDAIPLRQPEHHHHHHEDECEHDHHPSEHKPNRQKHGRRGKRDLGWA